MVRVHKIKNKFVKLKTFLLHSPHPFFWLNNKRKIIILGDRIFLFPLYIFQYLSNIRNGIRKYNLLSKRFPNFNNKLLSDYVKSDFILNDFNAELNLLNIYSDQKYNIFQSRNSEKIVNQNGILIVFSSTLLLWLFTNFVIVVIYFFYNNYKQNLKLND